MAYKKTAAKRPGDRGKLRKAAALHDEAGWVTGDDGKRRNANGETLRNEFLEDDAAFDRAWVDELLERANLRTREVLLASGHGLRYRVFEAYELGPPGSQPTYQQVASALGLSVSDVRNHLFAVRERLRAEIRAELRETVSSTDALEAEWRELFCD